MKRQQRSRLILAKLADTCSCKDTFFLFRNDRRLHRLELATDYICGCTRSLSSFQHLFPEMEVGGGRVEPYDI